MVIYESSAQQAHVGDGLRPRLMRNVMPIEAGGVRYATGEVARRGDRVLDHAWVAVVEDVIASAEDMSRWGLSEPGLMLETEPAAGGRVFCPCSSVCWEAVVLQGRSRNE